MVGVVELPDRFVSGESGALVNAVNGRAALPPGRKTRASDSGAGNRPTLLSNAETFAQLAVLAMVGPEGYASAGTAAEPGTVLLTVGGAVTRPAVVEVPTGLPLGQVLDLCEAGPGRRCAGRRVPRRLAAGGGRLRRAGQPGRAGGGRRHAGRGHRAGHSARTAARSARWPGWPRSSPRSPPASAGRASWACRASRARWRPSPTAPAGVEALDAARRGAAAVRGRGACSHPDGVFRFVLSALDVFADDLAAHLFRGGCGRPVSQLPAAAPGGRRERS